jgi:glutamyl-tRNA synthetase
MPFLPELDAASVERAAPAVKERIEKLSKARELLDYLWEEPPPPELNPDAVSMVREAIDPLVEVEWTPDAIHSLLERIREERGWSRGKFFSALRLSVARPISPPIHDTLALLSKEEALRRLRRAAA